MQCAEDIHSLNGKQLGQLLKHHGRGTSGKKTHKISVLYQLYGFTNEPGTFSRVLSDIKSTKKGWTKDIRQAPAIGMREVVDYLLKSHDTVTHTSSGDIEVFTAANLRRYKTLRSYTLYKSGHVHSMSYLPMNDLKTCAIKAMCNPSWDTSGKTYSCVVAIDKDSESPIGSSCECTAGQGEACTHVAAMLFAIEDFTSLGYHSLPDDPASTELLCAWNGPKSVKVCSKGYNFKTLKTSNI